MSCRSIKKWKIFHYITETNGNNLKMNSLRWTTVGKDSRRTCITIHIIVAAMEILHPDSSSHASFRVWQLLKGTSYIVLKYLSFFKINLEPLFYVVFTKLDITIRSNTKTLIQKNIKQHNLTIISSKYIYCIYIKYDFSIFKINTSR